MAIDSARLYKEARAKAKFEHEMALAKDIQAALLQPPPELEQDGALLLPLQL